MENNKRFLNGVLCGVFVTIIFGMILFYGNDRLREYVSVSAETEKTSAENSGNILNIDKADIQKKVENIEAVINHYYLDNIDTEQVENQMYKGLVAGLGDPYASYYTAEELQKMQESTAGQYVGIGATLTQDKNTGIISIVRCFEGTPSEQAGLLPGDIIYKLNDTEVTGMDLNTVVTMIKTEEGASIRLSIARDGETDYLEFDVERQEVKIPTVTYEMLEGKTGYIAITEFDTITEEQFNTALAELEAQGMEKLIIDLRNNLGGVLQTVCNMLEQMLPEGLIVYTENKDGERTEYKSDGKHQFQKPLAVLINENSASASEIFAGAIKDYGIGTLVGTTTYGKGIVQRIVNLDDGTAVKLTIAKYYTPNGNDIHGKGIEPDVEVELNDNLKQKTEIEKEEDNQLQKAIEILSVS